MKVILSIAAVFAVFAMSTEGLECFTCYYADMPNPPDSLDGSGLGAGMLPHHLSCEEGENPDPNLIQLCPNMADVCFKINGAILTDGTKYIYGAIRGCSSLFSDYNGKCETIEIPDQTGFPHQTGSESFEFVNFEAGRSKSLAENESTMANFTVCGCDGNRCNV